jgi:molecular chaperone GrpE
MSESPPPGVAENAAVAHPEALTPEGVARVLADFRAWLEETYPSLDSSPLPPSAEPAAKIDLHTLLAQFVALRHEVNLQTRATRAQQEHNGEALRQLGQALELLRRSQESARDGQQQASEEALRPLYKALVDVYDALTLATREVQRMQETVVRDLEQLVPAVEPVEEVTPPEVPGTRLPFWARWLGVKVPDNAALAGFGARLLAERRREHARQQEQAQRAQEGVERVRQVLSSLLTGYTMSVQRVERALRQHGLEPLAAVGKPFDPELMEVLEAVTGSGRPAGEVLDEVRRGYLLNGRIFRCAQVRVARS